MAGLDPGFVGPEACTNYGLPVRKSVQYHENTKSGTKFNIYLGPLQGLGRGPCKRGVLNLKLHYLHGNSAPCSLGSGFTVWRFRKSCCCTVCIRRHIIIVCPYQERWGGARNLAHVAERWGVYTAILLQTEGKNPLEKCRRRRDNNFKNWTKKISMDCCGLDLSTRVSQMKNLKYFYLLIYWMQKVHNDFISVCSLHCVLSATLHTMSIIFDNLQGNRVAFRICIVLLRFSFVSPS